MVVVVAVVGIVIVVVVDDEECKRRAGEVLGRSTECVGLPTSLCLVLASSPPSPSLISDVDELPEMHTDADTDAGTQDTKGIPPPLNTASITPVCVCVCERV